MEIQLYFRMLQKGWWLIVLATLAAVIISLSFSFATIPQYQASAHLIISPNASLTSGSDVVRSLDTLDRLSTVTTYAEVLGSNRVYEETLGMLQLKASDLVAYTRSAVVLPDSSILEIRISGPNPTLAAELANAISRQMINYTGQLNQVYEVDFLDVATPPLTPFSPQPLRDVSLALVLGLAIGGVLAILREQIRQPLDALLNRFQVDGTSSALNRRSFEKTLTETLARNQENISLGLIHLEGLNNLMETLPLSVSQQLLHEVTARLRKELRGNDYIGRWGDTEFAVMLPATPANAAERTLERIKLALSEEIRLEQLNTPIKLVPSVGVSVRAMEESPQTLIGRAEKTLELARQKQAAGGM